MRKVFVLSLVIFTFMAFAGCSITYIEPESIILTKDYTKYSRKGFLFTPFPYDGEYEACGAIESVQSPGAEYKREGKAKRRWVIKKISWEDALDEIYEDCVKMGADALVNMKTEMTFKTYNPGKVEQIKIPQYFISGYAIKRKADGKTTN